MYFHFIVALIVAIGTYLFGWWAVAVVALIAGLVTRNQGGRAGLAALGSAEGWALLLIIDSLGGRSRELMSMLQGTMNIPAPVLIVATLLFPALIGWSAAALAAEVGQRVLSPKRIDADAPVGSR